MKDAFKMYRRLYSLAYRRFGCSADQSADVAAHAICAMLEAGTDEFAYGAKAARNKVIMDDRNQRRRKTYQFPVDENGQPIELSLSAHIAEADQALIASECLTAIANLPDGTREVMQLVAQEYTPDEIMLERGLPKSEVYWRTQLGRKLLRGRAGYELERKRGHHQYIGIRRDCRKWVAAIRKGEEYFHIGYFDSAAEAAKAYDAKAKELFGDKAKLNFTREAS